MHQTAVLGRLPAVEMRKEVAGSWPREVLQVSAIRSASLELTSRRGGVFLMIPFTATEPTCLLRVQVNVLIQADGNHYKGTGYFAAQG
jgi:hypothetical protein